MGNLLYNIIRFFVKYVYLKLVFYKVEKTGWEKIPKDVPILFAVTHPLMYIDALVLGCSYHKPLYFITKSTVFKGKFNKWLFQKLNMIPVVRKQDVPKGQPFSNKDMFKHCIDTLTKGGDILIFSEGTSIWERKLRGLKSGTARIALETEVANQFQSNVHIVPVALNYTHIGSVFPSVSIEIGDPIQVRDYKEDYEKNSGKTAQEITKKIEEEILKSYFTLPNLEAEAPLVQAVTMYTETTPFKRKQSLRDYFHYLNKGLDFLEKLSENQLNTIKEKIENYDNLLKKNKIKDESFWHTEKNFKSVFSLVFRSMITLLILPFHWVNWILNKIPYKLSKSIALKTSDEMEVWGANLIALCGIIFPIFYFTYLMIAYFLAGGFVWYTFLVVLIFPFFTYASYFFNSYIHFLLSDWRVFLLSKRNKTAYQSIKKERKEIIEAIDLIINQHGKEA
ncbi:1-acyl-sn-glycerol-3-phosphate acyltransferase [Flammeovirga sp. EKP202]|uniref:1-acyl-sn-glycerol-3-phosphate acyltransferase n=1 Tax=Flammeovirga sp. EKP202 TaxID=2770592 RepID=UPI00165FD07F|nr:1-acyl-sn-glycerol-3-phosphate acyltransferase [Flammeovirga sp. EKP202]MBD0404585.1 1-acyl-sn-glycerol-3-phosphate acyltransferase [Flammeovirga sp. EKP202]